jgi:hypothetical protein
LSFVGVDACSRNGGGCDRENKFLNAELVVG